MKKIFICFICCFMPAAMVHAQANTVDQTFWSQEVSSRQQWGIWLKETYKPYSVELEKAILKIISSTKGIDSTGKSSEKLMEEIKEAYHNGLKSMELVNVPPELKAYHKKVIELYRYTIDSDPKEESKNALVIKQLNAEADRAITRAFQLHGIPQSVISRFTAD